MQRRVERGRLTGTGRSCDEQGAGRLLDRALQFLVHVLGQAQTLQRRRLLRLVDQAHNHDLALDGRQHGNTDIERPTRSLGVQ